MKSSLPCLRFALSLALCFGAALTATAAPTIALGADSSFGLSFDPRADLAQGPTDGYAWLQPMASLSSGPLELRLTIDAKLSSGQTPRLYLGESYARLFVTDSMLAEAGRYRLKPGNALYLSSLSLFSSDSILDLIEPSGSEQGLSDQLELKLLGQSFHLSVAWQPSFIPFEYEAPDPDGLYFPSASIPSSVSYDALLVQSKRSGIAFIDSVDLSSRSTGPGDFLVNLGCTQGAFDLGMVYFHGLCRDPAYLPSLNFGKDFYSGSFVLELEPNFDKVDALGGCCSFFPQAGRLGAIEFRAEGLYTWNKLYSRVLSAYPTPIYHDGIASAQVGELWKTDEIRFTLGGTWSAPSFPLSIFLECRDAIRPWAGDSSGAGDFSDILLSGLQSSFLDGRIEGLLVGATSISGGGWVLALQLNLHGEGESTLSCTLPVFLGAADSDLGQFAGKERISLLLDTKLGR